MKTGFVPGLAALLLFFFTAAKAADPRWETMAGQWDFSGGKIAPSTAGQTACGRWMLADRSMPWDSEWFSLSVDFTLPEATGSDFGILLHVESPDDYQLLRIVPAAEQSTLQMLHWKYGYFRQWQETRFAALRPGAAYNLSIVKAPVVDREDWRMWKIIVTDRSNGQVLLKEGIENQMPAFGLGITGLYAACDAVVFSDYRLERPVPENMAGALRLPMIFSDGMVLQRDRRNPVWGKAEAGSAVEVTLAGRTYKTRADAQGDWRIELKPMPADTGLTMHVVSEKNELTLRDIAVGEVWIASGQSNMEMKTWETDVPQTTDPDIRLFSQLQWPSEEPMFTSGGRWQKSDGGGMPRWSAVAYAFAQELRRKLGVPVGIVGCYFGGTAIESWIPRPLLAEDSISRPIYDRYTHSLELLEHNLPLYDFPQSWDVAGQLHTPGNLFNGMVSPHAPYGASGFIWYQGESSTSKARQYGTLFPMLIDSWRQLWGDPRLKFYYVQLAGYDGRQSGSEIESAWPQLRDIQRRTLDLRDHTGMVVAFHLGDSLNIHPPHKNQVGIRLANLALHDLYGFSDIARSSPLPDRVTYAKGQAVVSFGETAGGLVSGDGKALSGFLIAGADRRFYPAVATIDPDGARVTVRSDRVPEPVAVRYGWENFTSGANLANRAGLPAAPFRTDDWPLATDNNL